MTCSSSRWNRGAQNGWRDWVSRERIGNLFYRYRGRSDALSVVPQKRSDFPRENIGSQCPVKDSKDQKKSNRIDNECFGRDFSVSDLFSDPINKSKRKSGRGESSAEKNKMD